jgi:two-component system OmpR family response regulator
MKILLAEDDAKTASFVVKGLEQAAYLVEHCSDGQDALFKAVNRRYDAVIMDIMMPGIDGLSVIGKMREKNIKTPVIILSAKGSVDDRIKGLQKGGDDYLVKPFAFSELLARVQALVRRSSESSEPSSLVVGDLTMEILSRKVYRGGERIDIQPLEYALLEYLMRNAGRVVSKTMIMENVWEYNFDPQTNVVEARICKLRDKIDKPFKKKLIHTARGFGYVLEDKG